MKIVYEVGSGIRPPISECSLSTPQIISIFLSFDLRVKKKTIYKKSNILKILKNIIINLLSNENNIF